MNKFAKQLLPFSSLLFIISLWTFLEPDTFLTFQNFKNVLSSSAANGIIAAGMTFVIITAGIDLSVGSMLAMCGIIGSIVMLVLSGATWTQISSGAALELGGFAMLVGTLTGMAVGALCGFLNGALVTRLKLAPFIVTLGSMSIFRGVSHIINSSRPIAVSAYSWLDTGSILGIPSAVIIFALVLLAMGYVLKFTPFGRYTYAIGSNPQTAYHPGVNVSKMLVWIYTILGALVGLAAMIMTSRASSAQPSAGLSLELDVIAAVIIGGCSPSGGKGT
ncbi:MAG: ABC transporter permease, partial [Victivallales bacterium]|nr:ABC transporter permease [Victivallales bacterium]